MLPSLLYIWRRTVRGGSGRRSARGGRRSPKRAAFRPGFESLETRAMPYATSLLPLLTAPPAGFTAAEVSGSAVSNSPTNRVTLHEAPNAYVDANTSEAPEIAVRLQALATPAHELGFNAEPASTPTEANATLSNSATETPTVTLTLNALGTTGGAVAVMPLATAELNDTVALGILDPATDLEAGSATNLALHTSSAADRETLVDFSTDVFEPATTPSDATAVAVALQLDVPPEVEAGQPVEVTIIAVETSNRPASSYAGTVQLSSSDAAASLPSALTFRPTDNGIRVAELLFSHPGKQTITVADGANALRETVTIVVRRSVARRTDRRQRHLLDIWMQS